LCLIPANILLSLSRTGLYFFLERKVPKIQGDGTQWPITAWRLNRMNSLVPHSDRILFFTSPLPMGPHFRCRCHGTKIIDHTILSINTEDEVKKKTFA